MQSVLVGRTGGGRGAGHNINIRAPSNSGGDEPDFSALAAARRQSLHVYVVYDLTGMVTRGSGWIVIEAAAVVIDLQEGRGKSCYGCPLRSGQVSKTFFSPHDIMISKEISQLKRKVKKVLIRKK